MSDPQAKRVFQYSNGKDTVFADPLRLYRELKAKVRNWDEANKAAAEGDAIAEMCIADNVREVFGMVPFDKATGTGATEEDVENVLTQLYDYLEKKSASTDGSPSS